MEIEENQEMLATQPEHFNYENFDEIAVEGLNDIGFNNSQFQQTVTIEYIDCENFKSFAGKVRMGQFTTGFSSIIGPNGSGKSNVIDSLLFVFGYRASKIRSKKLNILIHRSSAAKNLNSCSVEVTFAIRDTTDDLKKIGNFILKRTAYQNNSSNYYIDGVQCSHKDVKAKLKLHGVDIDHSRFLILQGEVEQISLMKPKKQPNDANDGMLDYIEDIIGTSVLKDPINKYNERIIQLEEYKAYLVSDKKFAEEERKKLELQNSKAITFLKKENEYSCASFFVISSQKNMNNTKLDEIKSKLDFVQPQIDEIILKQTEKDGEIKHTQKEMNKKSKERQKLTNLLAELKNELSDISANENKYKKLQTHARNECKKLTSKLESLKEELSENNFDPKQIEQRLIEIRSDISSLEAEFEQINKDLESAYKEYQNESKELQKQQKPESEKLSKIQDKHNKLKLEISHQKSKMELFESELKTLESKKSKFESDLINLEDDFKIKEIEIKGFKEQIEQYQCAIKSAQSDLAQIDEKLLKSEKELSDKREKFQLLSQHLDNNFQKQNKLLEFLFKQKSQKKINGNIYGRLGDLGAVEKLLDVSVSTASSKFDNIVVDKMDTAIECVELMKKNNAGKATFIALDKMKPAPPQKNITKYSSGSMLYDLIVPADEKYLSAFKFALGDTLVADNEDSATKIAFGDRNKRNRVVTLNGVVIEVSGAMSGGGKPSSGKLKLIEGHHDSTKINEKTFIVDPVEIQQLKYSIDQLIHEITSYHDSKNLILSTQKECEQIINGLCESIRCNKKSLINESNKREKLLSDINLIKSQCLNFAEKNKHHIENYNSNIQKLESEDQILTKELEKQQLIYDSIDNELNNLFNTLVRPLENKTNQIKGIINSKKEDLATCNTESLEKKMELLKEQIQSTNSKLEDKNKKLSEIKANIEKNDDCKIEIGHKITEVETSLKSEKNMTMSENSTETALQKELQTINEELKRLNSEHKTLIKYKEALKTENCELSKAIKELYITDLESLEKKPVDSDEIENNEFASLSFEEIKGEAFRLNKEFKQLEVPDLRYIKLFKEKDKIYQEKLKALEIHDQIDCQQREFRNKLRDLRYSSFNKSFSVVNKHLKKLYNLITMGGIAELEFVDSLSPFEQGIQLTVMPPQKSWKAVGNLPGGEKTLSSLSLVFALHSLRPSPFYVLDEIDAALDYRNVSIISEYIQKQANHFTQFMVISLREQMFINADIFVAIYKFNEQTRSVAIINPDKKQQISSTA